MSKENKENMEHAYKVQCETAVKKTTELLEHLEFLMSPANRCYRSNKNWGHVGSLNKVNEDLAEIKRFLNIR